MLGGPYFENFEIRAKLSELWHFCCFFVKETQNKCLEVSDRTLGDWQKKSLEIIDNKFG